MQEVKSLGYADKPDYAKLRSILQQGFKSIGASDDKKLDFTVSANGKVLPSVKVSVSFIKTSQSQCLIHFPRLEMVHSEYTGNRFLTPSINNKLI